MFLIKHKYAKRWLKYNSMLLLLLVLSSCGSATVTNNPLIPSSLPSNHSSSALFYDPPDCAILMPVRGYAHTNTPLVLENVIERHFSGRFKKFISGATRRTKIRQGSFNLDIQVERQRFSKSVKCNYGLYADIKAINQNYLMTWASRNITLKIELVRLSDQTVLWSATHTAERSQGGIPTGPLSLALDTRSASLFVIDQDGFEALIEDVVRQLTKTLPLNG